MRTIHEFASNDSMQHAIEKHPEIAAKICTFQANAGAGRIPDWFLAWSGWANSMPLYQSWDAMRLWFGMAEGLFFDIHVGEVPGPDRKFARNERVLRRATATHALVGLGNIDIRMSETRNADQDGFIVWEHLTGFDDFSIVRSAVSVSAAANVPLEIGSTKPSRSSLHMAMYGALARWPYGYDKIIVGVLGVPR